MELQRRRAALYLVTKYGQKVLLTQRHKMPDNNIALSEKSNQPILGFKHCMYARCNSI